MKKILFVITWLLSGALLWADPELITYDRIQGVWSAEEVNTHRCALDSHIDTIYVDGDMMLDTFLIYGSNYERPTCIIKGRNMLWLEYSRNEQEYVPNEEYYHFYEYTYVMVKDEFLSEKRSAIGREIVDMKDSMSNAMLAIKRGCAQDGMFDSSCCSISSVYEESKELKLDLEAFDFTEIRDEKTFYYQEELDSVVATQLFAYSISQKTDYFSYYLDMNVGEMKTDNSRVKITDEKPFRYYVEPLGDCKVKKGWVKKREVRLLKDMVR